MKTLSGRGRHGLLIVATVGGAVLATSSAFSPGISSPRQPPAAAQLLRDACALVEPVDAPSSPAASAIPPELKWKHRKLGAGVWPAIATSAAGEPHIVFRVAPAARDLKHAWRVGNSWHSETIFSAPDPALLGEQTAVAVGSDGVVHVAFATHGLTPLSGELHYAKGDGSSWQVETVEPDDSGSLALALDESGVPHILHNGLPPDGGTRYLTLEPGGWMGAKILDSASGIAALQIHDSKVYALFADGGNLSFGIGDSRGWTFDVFANGSGSTFAFDTAGVLHVAYVLWTGSHALIHASLTESDWTSETLVDSTSLFGEQAPSGITFLPSAPVITTDASGRIHVAFGLDVYEGAKFGKAMAAAVLEEGAWLPLLPGKSLTGFENSITVDVAGIPEIATVKSLFGVDPPKTSIHEYSLRGSKLSLSVMPKGSGTISVAPLGVEVTGKSSVRVFPGDTVTLTASAGDGFEFAGWIGTTSGTDPMLDLTMDHASKAIAHFVPTEP
jgi:hypothetical protein